MRRFTVSLAAICCAFVVSASSGIRAQVNDQAELAREIHKFQGTWTIESSVTGGMEIPADQLKEFVVIYEGEKHTVKMGDTVIQVGTQTIDPTQSPKTIDVTMSDGPSKGAVMLGIYEFDGDTLKVCFDSKGKTRPTEFKSPEGTEYFVNVHKRISSSAHAEPSWDQVLAEHKLLERLVGEWNFEKRSVSDDGSEPQSLGTGVVSAELVGGFFVVSRWVGNVYGTDYKAVQSLGYDIAHKTYTGCWIDSTMSYRWELSGAVDEKSKELTISASGPSPTGGTCTFRERYQFNSADSITIIGEMLQGDKWVAFLTTDLARKR